MQTMEPANADEWEAAMLVLGISQEQGTRLANKLGLGVHTDLDNISYKQLDDTVDAQITGGAAANAARIRPLQVNQVKIFKHWMHDRKLRQQSYDDISEWDPDQYDYAAEQHEMWRERRDDKDKKQPKRPIMFDPSRYKEWMRHFKGYLKQLSNSDGLPLSM